MIIIRELKIQNKMNAQTFTITKKIAKHGNQSVIIIPRILENRLVPGTIIEVMITVLEEQKKW